MRHVIRIVTVFVALICAPMVVAAQQVPVSQEQVKLSYSPVVKKAAPAVVNIYTTRKVRVVSPFANDPFFSQFFGAVPRERVENSLGSGVIIKPEGLVVTSYHVIKGSDEIRVVLADKREYAATVKTADEQTDLALLTLAETKAPLPYLTIVDSDALEVGDMVLAIGNPFGVGQTVTSGIVSANARAASGVSDYQFFIQTDAAINPGNSGGALVDMQGNLIGINTAIYSTSGGSNGIGFAIPSNMVTALLGAESKEGKVVKPWLGVAVQAVTQDIAESLGMEVPDGVLVKSVYPGSPADSAGIKVGDVILSIGGKEVDDEQSLNFRIGTRRIDEEVAVEILRSGSRETLAVTLAAPKEEEKDVRTLKGKHPLRGMVVANLTPTLAQELGYPMTQKGVVVIEGGAGGIFGIGLMPGDIILKVNNREVSDTASLDRMLQGARKGLQITYNRGGSVMNLSIQGLW